MYFLHVATNELFRADMSKKLERAQTKCRSENLFRSEDQQGGREHAATIEQQTEVHHTSHVHPRSHEIDLV